MGFPKALARTCDGFLDRVLCVAGAVLFSQAPEFMQQYLQRLGGHVDEARRQVDQFRHIAQQSNLTLDQFIEQTGRNADTAVAKLGTVMSGASARLDSLDAAQNALLHATPFTRPIVFFQHLDRDIAAGTWHAFQPAVPTTLEGLIYAFAGMFIVLGLYHALFRYPATAVYRARRKKPTLYAEV